VNPAFSVIFFTVTAGAGYGLLFLLAFSRLGGLAPDISPDQIAGTGILGLVLVTLGLLSSTLHLANPRNAWRSFVRFRTSWLSREAVFAVLFYPLSLAWLVVEWTQGNVGASATLGVLSALLAVVVLICTAMIYASLKTIRQWNTALTPVNFVLLAMLLGALVFLVVLAFLDLPTGPLAAVTLVVLCAAALVKLVYFHWIGQPQGPTINTALGFTRATVRLLDVGHAADTFHTREFGFEMARTKLVWIRVASVVLAFVVPLALVAGLVGAPSVGHLVAAAVSAYVGVFLERWLFFAEARHVVNLYHGAQRT